MNKAREKGIKGELVAKSYLQKKGYEILCCNFFSRYGEIDIVAKHKDHLVFCEVKTYKAKSFLHPLEAITEKKIERMAKTAEFYLEKNSIEEVSVRFDVLIIGNRVVLEHLKDAV